MSRNNELYADWLNAILLGEQVATTLAIFLKAIRELFHNQILLGST